VDLVRDGQSVITAAAIYLGLITGEHPDPDRAARVINALMPS
jgi:hypothetical protein